MFNVKRKWSCIFMLAFVFLVSSLAFANQEKSHLKSPEYVPGEVLVKFRSNVSRSIARATHRFIGSRSIKRFSRINVEHIKVPDGWTVEETIKMYELDPDVEYAEPNYYRYAMATPNDTYFQDGLLWGLNNEGQSVNGTSGTADADIDAPEAWDTHTGSSTVVVAVIDTGVDYDHVDLSGNIWENSDEKTGDDNGDGFPGVQGKDDDGDGLIDEDSQGREPGDAGYTNDLANDDDENGYADDIYGWNFVNDDNDPDDDDNHGTHVAGIAGAVGNNNEGITGVSWTCKLMVLKAGDSDGDFSVSDEVGAIEYAYKNGAHIINASFGGATYSQSERNAIEDAKDNGLLFVAAAGNDGNSQADYPARYTLDNIISVAATDQDDNLASFSVGSSNYNVESVDVAAPGKNIYSTKPNDTYQYLSGTSMATPHVSGLAALIWAQETGLTYTQVKDRILNGVDTKSSLNGKVLTGGRINANNSILNSPSPPSDLVATAASSTQIDLTWTDNSYGEDGFKIERKAGEGAYSQIHDTETANITSYSDAELSSSTTYYYRVRSYKSDRNSSYSNEASATTPGGSSSSGGGGGGGCFIATAVHGSAHYIVAKSAVLLGIFIKQIGLDSRN